MSINRLSLKAEDAADELAAYFETARYEREVKRQTASHTLGDLRRRNPDFGLEQYWRDTGYGHSANLAALSAREAKS